MPRFPAVEPREAAATFQIKPGFRAELIASEPLVTSPIAVSFDENGRLFVLEMRDYSEERDEQPHLGRVRLLTSTKGDGRYDHAEVFADNLPWPTGLIWAQGELFVVASPDIWRLRDTDGDGHADRREIVFTGFNTGNPKLNVQALPNCFAWGPDHRIHLQSSSGNRGLIRSPLRPDLAPQELAARDFWFDPRTLDFGFEAGGGQYGMSYDDAGRRFVCNNSDHLRTYLFDTRYAARNPACPLPSPLVSVAADGPAAEVFRISPDEPWRVVRTRWRVSGKVPGLTEGGGRVSGYFTGASGTTVYRGDALGAAFVGNTFTGDAGGNLLHRKVLRSDGVSVIGERPADERNVEFLASRDTWFRPVNFANAPDGALWVIDMYREVIEHPWSLPEPIKQHLDLNSGRDRGRLWRIAPEGFQPRPLPQLGKASTDELVATLAHPNGWHRDTADRLLWERRDRAALPSLERLLTESQSPLGRLHALRAVDGLDALTDAAVLAGLADADEAVRELAVRLSEKRSPDGRVPESLWPRLAALTEDPAPRVRLQLAFTLGGVTNDGAVSALAALARRDAGDRWISAAMLTLMPGVMSPLAAKLLEDTPFAASAAGESLLVPLVTGIGTRHDRAEVEALVARFAGAKSSDALVLALGEGLRRAGMEFASFDRAGQLTARYTTARDAFARRVADERAAVARAQPPAPAQNGEKREDVITRLTPALQLAGEVARGHEIFQQRCAICHRLRGEGYAFGPDLESVVAGGKEKLLTHLVDPNRELAPQYAAYTLELTDGTALAGVLAAETPEAITLHEPLGRETTIARSRVTRAQTTGKSPMPEGLEAGLSVAEVASLLEFLTAAPQR